MKMKWSESIYSLAYWVVVRFMRPSPKLEKMVDDALKPDPAVTYQLPGAPPLGSRLRTVHGDIFVRVNPQPEEPQEMWGIYQEIPDDFLANFAEEIGSEVVYVPERLTWSQLLTFYGPVTLLPPTDEEIEMAKIYGPVGARWGDPYTPCPFQAGLRKCSLGTHHVGPHRDTDGEPLGLTAADWRKGKISAAVSKEDLETLCTCGRPGMHDPGCPRYSRITGKGETSEDA